MGWIDDLTKQTVVVHLVSGNHSFKGVLFATHADCLVLREAAVLEPDSQTFLDGDVVVPRSNVDFLQIVTPA